MATQLVNDGPVTVQPEVWGIVALDEEEQSSRVGSSLPQPRGCGSLSSLVPKPPPHTWRAVGTAIGLLTRVVTTFRDGRVIHFRSYRDPEEALEAAGLSEQGAHADS